MQLLDCHVHLTDARISRRLDGILARASAAGIHRMFCNSSKESDWDKVTHLSKRVSSVLPFIGIHPWFADAVIAGWEERLHAILATERIGIGEIGLDKRCNVPSNRQEEVFLAQFQLALAHERPLVLHCLQRWGRLVDLTASALQREQGFQIMIHSFSGSTEIMKQLVDLGYFISYSMKLAGFGQDRLRATFKATPLERILLETDSPDQLNPLFLDTNTDRPIDNEPAFILKFYRFAADLKEVSLADFRAQIWKNGKIFAHSLISR